MRPPEPQGYRMEHIEAGRTYAAERIKGLSRRLSVPVMMWGGLAALFALSFMAPPAQAQGRLEARYTATIAGIPIGRGSWAIDIGPVQYTAAASGRVIGLLKVLSNGEGTVAAHGTIDGGRLLPTAYAARVTVDDKVDEVRMTLNSGTVTEVTAEPPYPPVSDRVPVTDAHRRGVLDPMTAGLMELAAPGQDLVSPEACRRTLHIFDGRQRFDLMLSFKRMEQVKADKGYEGPVVVCMVTYQPVSGHRPGRAAIRYLMGAKEMEMWLAPIAGTRILVPFRVSVPTLIGPAVLEATQFVTAVQASRASTTGLKTE